MRIVQVPFVYAVLIYSRTKHFDVQASSVFALFHLSLELLKLFFYLQQLIIFYLFIYNPKYLNPFHWELVRQQGLNVEKLCFCFVLFFVFQT